MHEIFTGASLNDAFYVSVSVLPLSIAILHISAFLQYKCLITAFRGKNGWVSWKNYGNLHIGSFLNFKDIYLKNF